MPDDEVEVTDSWCEDKDGHIVMMCVKCGVVLGFISSAKGLVVNSVVRCPRCVEADRHRDEFVNNAIASFNDPEQIVMRISNN